MAIEIAGHRFDGPFASPWSMANEAGVFVVLCEGRIGYRVVDVGESEAVRDAVVEHPRSGCWVDQCPPEGRALAVRYMRFSGVRHRREVVRQIRSDEQPPCGGK